MTKHTVLVIGSGGREHTLAWSLARSPQVERIFVAPGNGGTAWPPNPAAHGLQPRAGAANIPLEIDDLKGLANFAQREGVDLTIVGPEAALALGIADAFQDAGLPIFGPCLKAAQLESSKAFAKDFMRQHHIPTGDYRVFDSYQAAQAYLDQLDRQVVVKADGLAAGKGVIVCDEVDQARAALHRIMVERAFGPAGDRVVIEERLAGPEISILAWSDGRTVIPIIPARDHKRVFDGDQGPNTGGMGAYTPAPDITPALVETVRRTVLEPAVQGLAAQGTPYLGILYAGLMLTTDGPKVLEFNCRFGDPETQAVLPLLETDPLDIFLACVEGRLDQADIRWRPEACATIVLASAGYPAAYPKNLPVTGLDKVAELENLVVFHAGTARSGDDFVTAGGRVLAVSALGNDLAAALNRAYDGVEQIHFEGVHYRRDIGRNYN